MGSATYTDVMVRVEKTRDDGGRCIHMIWGIDVCMECVMYNITWLTSGVALYLLTCKYSVFYALYAADMQ